MSEATRRFAAIPYRVLTFNICDKRGDFAIATCAYQPFTKG